MAKKKVGELIKEARSNAGLSQEKLASGIEGLSASDISKAERGEKELTQAQLKAIAKATGVTQKSLLEAAVSSKTTASKTTASKTTSAAKKTSSKTTAATEKAGSSKKTSTTGKTGSTGKSGSTGKTSAVGKTTSTGTGVQVTATEKKLLELYRAADTDTKKAAVALLKGEKAQTGGILDMILANASVMDTISGIFLKEE